MITVAKPDIDEADLDAVDDEKLQRLRSLEDGIIRGVDVSDQELHNSEITTCVLRDCTGITTNFNGSTLRDVIVDGSDLSASKFSDTTLTRVTFMNCRLQGINISSANLTDVAFVDCKLDQANFRMSSLRSVRFEGCDMSETEFLSGKLHDVEFASCDMTHANFIDVVIKNVDARTAELRDITGISSLKGLTISPQQIIELGPAMASALGLNVSD